MDKQPISSADCHSLLRRIVFSWFGLIAALVLLVVGFYRFESWRGRRAWQNYKAQLERAGEHLDWAYFIPPEVPASENFFEATYMQAWFQRNAGGGFPLQLPMRSSATTNQAPDGPALIESPNGQSYSVSFLKEWEEEHESELKFFFDASKRPHARSVGDFSSGLGAPIPNFVSCRSMTQTLATLAKAHLISGNSEEALRDLNGVNRIMAAMESSPVLVSAMVRVAIAGIYAEGLKDGLDRRAWSDAQLVMIQRQLDETRLLPCVHKSLRGGVAALLQVSDGVLLENAFGASRRNGSSGRNPLQKSVLAIVLSAIPSGWVEQNRCEYVRVMNENILSVYDPKEDRLDMNKLEQISSSLEAQLRHGTPFNFLARTSVPNLIKAFKTAANNQALLDEISIRVGLERYYLANGKYPENLQELKPEFIIRLPVDVYTGQSFVYERNADGQFTLHSTGLDKVRSVQEEARRTLKKN